MSILDEQEVDFDDYMTVKGLCNRYPIFKPGGVRADIFHAETNGLQASGALHRKGRKVILYAPGYFRWAVLQNKAA